MHDQPNYPFWFHQGDALDVLRRLLAGEAIPFRRMTPNGGEGCFVRLADFVAAHASPPCQSYTDLAKLNGTVDKWPRLINPTRDLLIATGLPYVIENVEGAESDLQDPITLCGTQFPGLRVLRHRLFESNVTIEAPAEHPKHPLVFTHDKRKRHYGQLDQNTSFVQVTGGGNCSIANARDAMGIDWMTKGELNEALPPAYTEFIGAQIIDHLSQTEAKEAA